MDYVRPSPRVPGSNVVSSAKTLEEIRNEQIKQALASEVAEATTSKKTPEAVPISELPPEKQAELKKLEELRLRQLSGESESDKETQPETKTLEHGTTQLDVNEFRRAILGHRPFEKSYRLFDGIDVLLVDRSVATTNHMYEAIQLDVQNNKIEIKTQAAWQVWRERYHLAAVFRKMPGVPGFSFESPPAAPKDFHQRWETLTALSRPLYEAILECSRQFENQIAYLTRKATDQDFWKTGGEISQ